jgi:hypothetical protein
LILNFKNPSSSKTNRRPSCAGRNHPYAIISPATSDSVPSPPAPAVILAKARIHPRPLRLFACGGQTKQKEKNKLYISSSREGIFQAGCSFFEKANSPVFFLLFNCGSDMPFSKKEHPAWKIEDERGSGGGERGEGDGEVGAERKLKKLDVLPAQAGNILMRRRDE